MVLVQWVPAVWARVQWVVAPLRTDLEVCKFQVEEVCARCYPQLLKPALYLWLIRDSEKTAHPTLLNNHLNN